MTHVQIPAPGHYKLTAQVRNLRRDRRMRREAWSLDVFPVDSMVHVQVWGEGDDRRMEVKIKIKGFRAATVSEYIDDGLLDALVSNMRPFEDTRSRVWDALSGRAGSQPEEYATGFMVDVLSQLVDRGLPVSEIVAAVAAAHGDDTDTISTLQAMSPLFRSED